MGSCRGFVVDIIGQILELVQALGWNRLGGFPVGVRSQIDQQSRPVVRRGTAVQGRQGAPVRSGRSIRDRGDAIDQSGVPLPTGQRTPALAGYPIGQCHCPIRGRSGPLSCRCRPVVLGLSPIRRSVLVPNLPCRRGSAREACRETVVHVRVPITLIGQPIAVIGVAVASGRRGIAFFGLVVPPAGGVVTLTVFEVAVVGVVVALVTFCVAVSGVGIAVVTVEVAFAGVRVALVGETVAGLAFDVESIRDHVVVMRRVAAAIGAAPPVNVGVIGPAITRIRPV